RTLEDRRNLGSDKKEPASPMARHCASSHQGAGLKTCAALVRAALLATPRPERRRLDYARSRHHLLPPRRASPILSRRGGRRNVSCDPVWTCGSEPGNKPARVQGARL